MFAVSSGRWTNRLESIYSAEFAFPAKARMLDENFPASFGFAFGVMRFSPAHDPDLAHDPVSSAASK
ncbi:MAG: hypothetical protein WAO00_10170 [Chthoniobacterales bacterium]